MQNIDLSESQRLCTLASYRIVDSRVEPVFDRLTQLIANICETPMATITFIDATRQWFKSSVGMELKQTHREISFCTHAIASTSLFVVEDALLVPEFSENPLTKGSPGIRFYAGMPLVSPEGDILGTLAVMDKVPRVLTALQREALATLADQVIAQLVLRRERYLSDERTAKASGKTDALIQIANNAFQVGTWELTIPELRLTCSDAMCDLHDIRRGTSLHWDEWLAFFVPEARKKMVAALETCLRSGQGWDMELELVTAGGRRIWVRSSSHTLPWRDGAVHSIHGTLQDLSITKLSERAANDSERRFRQLADAMPYIVWSAKPDGEIDYGNQAIVDYAGLHDIGSIAGRWLGFLHAEDVQPTMAKWMECVQTGKIFSFEYRLLRAADQTYRWHLAKGMPIRDEKESIVKWYGTTMDIHDMKLAYDEIGRLAFYDSLTGLANRQLLMDRLSHAQSLHSRNGRTGAVILLDLDKFKAINDTLGHDKGDILLKQVAQRLTTTVTDEDTVARLGGDEFVIVLEDMGANSDISAAKAGSVARAVVAALQEPFGLAGNSRYITASIGIALFGGTTDSVGDVLKRADLAMYQAKAAGRNAICFFEAEIHTAAIARAELEAQMRSGLHEDQFLLHYQPQVSSDGEVIGVEALVRWQHPLRGMVSPAEFIPIAEETGLILPLGNWILQTACEKLALFGSQDKTRHLSMSVNVSAVQFLQPNFVLEVLETLRQTGANPAKLKIELTESLLVDDIETAIVKISQLKERGVLFSLDDFGTGYSSLSYLKRLPLYQLKIDQSFVRNVMTDPRDAAIVNTIITLGHTMGMTVIAEGVETPEQRDFLTQCGCRSYQGYLFSRPLSCEQLIAYMASSLPD